MISLAFAQSFVAKVNRQLSVSVNIMNEKGIIIASSTPERIGTFHSAAYDMLQNKIPMLVTDNHNKPMIGVMPPGLNLLLMDGAEAIGVVGVRGDPKNVTPIAKMMKFAIESILDQNVVKFALSRDSTENKLTYALFFENPQNISRIKKLADRRGLLDACVREALLIYFESDNYSEMWMHILASRYNQLACYDKQDLLLLIDNQHAMLFKTLPEDHRLSFEPYIEECAKEIIDVVHSNISDIQSPSLIIKFYCGIPQNSLANCGKMYSSLQWLKKNKPLMTKSTVYLKDYILEYFVDSVISDKVSSMLDCYCNIVENAINMDRFKETARALILSNMKPQAAAQMLFMHKNTIMARMNKYKEKLGIAPLSNIQDTIFFIILYCYSIQSRKI